MVGMTIMLLLKTNVHFTMLLILRHVLYPTRNVFNPNEGYYAQGKLCFNVGFLIVHGGFVLY
jgi:hypothetical protein